MIDRLYRGTMLALMLIELMLLGWLVAIESRHTVVSPDPPAPARYVQFGMGPLILDTQTGKVCDSYVTGREAPGLPYPPCKF